MKNARDQFKHYAAAYRDAKNTAEQKRQEYVVIREEAIRKYTRFSKEHQEYIHGANEAWVQAEQEAEKASKLCAMAKSAYTQDVANRIADAAETVLNKYAGKPAGEKTCQKVYSEILKEALTEEELLEKGTYVYAESSCFGKESYALHVSPSTCESVALYPTNGRYIIDKNNKFVAATFIKKDVCLNVEKQLEKLNKQRQKVDEQIKKLAAAISAYNDIAGANANHINMPIIDTRV